MSTITITRPAALLHTTGEDLKALFGAVLPHAITDDDTEVPLLTQVHIEVRDGELRMACTDRFTLAVVRKSMSFTTEAFTCRFAVPGWEIGKIIEGLTAATAATLAIEENRLLITTGDTFESVTGCDSTLKWREALNLLLEPASTPAGRVLLDPKFLARLEPAQRLDEDAPMVIHVQGEYKPVIATLGTTFLALVMPKDLRHHNLREELLPARPLDGWFDLLDETPSASVPA